MKLQAKREREREKESAMADEPPSSFVVVVVKESYNKNI